ncbi:MAG: TIGR03960 family B12-binding radical SAM protein [Clostridia bacterium]|nr:TIGR03960 family B12-binding radical SAM protein [Clostridia bacterium]
MREDIKSFITKVKKPGRYTGGEPGSVYKNKEDVALRVAFCFPDTYEIGMSNLGMRILTGVLNEMDKVWCERVFAPWTDMEEEMRKRNVPLFAHESGDDVKDFDIVAFTLQYELCYTTALNMIDLAGLPMRRADRTEDQPIILAGGPCAYNPEPMADFVDIFSIGEGEEALPELAALYLSMKENGTYTKEAFLREASHIEGFYVPSLYDVSYNENGTVKSIAPKFDDVPAKVRKRIVRDVDKAYVPTNPVLPVIETVHDRITLEVFRGCIRGCRFCQAGFVTRPVREKTPDTLAAQAREIADNSGYDEISMCCLSISDYSKVNTFTDKLLEWTDDERINLSLPSLRADSFTKELMQKISTVRSSTLTFAPEAGSQRLRDVINKNVTEADILRAAGVAFAAGKNQVKLYFMNGLPYEKEEDIVGIADLAKKVIEEYYKTPGSNRKRQPQVTLSVACFIPKPFTPFQWERQNTAEELEAKQKLLLTSLSDRRIKCNYHDAKVSRLEAVFARGNRTLGAAIEEAVKRGMVFDAWEEMFDYDKWMEVFETTGIDPAFFANRDMDDEEILPWDMIDCGVSKSFLLRERHKSQEEATTPSCKEKCSACGANCLADPEQCRWCPGHKEEEAEYLGQNIKAEDVNNNSDDGKRDGRGAGAAKNPGKKPVRTIKFRFRETGALTYVSHLDINRAVMRGLVKSKLPLYYTEGFNPIPKLTFASPLSVGCGGENELAKFKIVEEVSDDVILERLRASMPDGIEVLEVYSSDSNFKDIAWAENEIDFKCSVPENAESELEKLFSGEVIVLKKTKSSEKEVDISPYFKDVSFERTDCGMRIKVFTCADNTNYLNPEYIAGVALKVLCEGDSGYHTINRKQFYKADGKVFR